MPTINKVCVASLIFLVSPAFILPIPLGAEQDVLIKITLLDSNKKLISSRTISPVLTTIGYSCWSAFSKAGSDNDAIADTATLLVMDMIQEHEKKVGAK